MSEIRTYENGKAPKTEFLNVWISYGFLHPKWELFSSDFKRQTSLDHFEIIGPLKLNKYITV